MGNMTLVQKDRYTLQLECFLTSLRCIGMIGSAFYNVSAPPMVNTVSFLTKIAQNFKQKDQFWAHQISLGNVMLYCKVMHSLLLECFITYLIYIGMIEGASGNVSDPLMVNTVSFLPNNIPNLKQNNQF